MRHRAEEDRADGDGAYVNLVLVLGGCTLLFFVVVLVNEHRYNNRRRNTAREFDQQRGRPMHSHPSWSRGAPAPETDLVVHIATIDYSSDAVDCGSGDAGSCDTGGGDCGGGD